MNKITIISLVSTGFLVTMPFEANALNSQLVSQNLLEKTNLRVAQGRPTYQRGYTVHYRSSRAGMASLLENRKWTLEGFHAERSDIQDWMIFKTL